MSLEPGLPPDDSATDPRAAPRKERRPTVWTSRTPYLVLAGGALVVLLVWGLIDAQLAETRAVASIPEATRSQLYLRILSNLQFCSGQSSDAFQRFCTAEATFVLDFPECDHACEQLARRFVSRPTR